MTEREEFIVNVFDYDESMYCGTYELRRDTSTMTQLAFEWHFTVKDVKQEYPEGSWGVDNIMDGMRKHGWDVKEVEQIRSASYGVANLSFSRVEE